jgi:hypothetical protein
LDWGHYSAMHLDLRLTPTKYAIDPGGTLSWDSRTGAFGGSLASLFDDAAKEAARWGSIPCGPQFQYGEPTTYPLRRAAGLAALLVWLRYELPLELEPYLRKHYPDPADKLPASQRRNIVY